MTLTQNTSANGLRVSITKKKILNVFVAGIGAVGGALIRQINDLNHHAFKINVFGVCNSRFTLWNSEDHPFDIERRFGDHTPTDWGLIPEQLINKSEGNLIFVDATGSQIVARKYHHLLDNGVHIATPSKRANTFEQEYFNKLINTTNTTDSEYRYETAVGAGLPVISTINTLLDSGDDITRISGVASGTMTYLFNELQNGSTFSSAVQKAKEQGYSEPDPRDDLSGEDVARKFLILARTCGYSLEREQIKVESLIPEELTSLSVEEFLNQLSNCDSQWKSKVENALASHKRLRYVGTFTPDGITVGVQETPEYSPIGGLKGTDNLIQIYTKRYASSPIVIQGPGAGKEVTAAGVLADIIDIGKHI